jgi:Tfp pilus assembly protein PilW
VDGPAGPGDFSRRSHHVFSGASQSVTEADCNICHDQSLHLTLKDGVSVKLKNPDGGAPFTFNGSGASMEPFCLACHDANGAAGNTHPFSDGKTPTDIAFGTMYSTALHNVKGLSCYGTGASGTGCHANGHGSKKKSHLAPDGVAANTTNYSEEEEGACIACHGPSGPGKNIAGQLGKTRDHGMDSATMAGRHAIGEALVPATYSGANRHVECTDCHNQHWLQSGTNHVAGTNAASDVIKFVSRIHATYGTTANVPPTFTPRTARDTTPAKEYEICFKCHSSWAYGSTPPNTPEGTKETDTSVDFNPKNKSFHPVTGQMTTNSYTIPTSTNGNKQTMNAPWDTAGHKLMYCTDCHGSETASDPNGPHGSTNNYMLPTSDVDKGFCLTCHKASVYNPSSNPGTAETGSRFDQQTTGNSSDSHYYHVTSKGYTCRACHGAVRTLPTGTSTKSVETGSAHGTNTVVGLMNGKGIRDYRAGYCYPTCHSSKSYTAGAE